MPFSVSFGANALEVPARRVEIEVTVQVHVGRRRVRAFLQAGVRQPIEDDVIGRPHQALDHAVAGGPAGRIENGVVDTEELGNRPLEPQRIFGISGQGGRTGAVHPVFLDHRLGDLLDLRIGGETEIILGGKVQAGKSDATVVARRAGGERRLLSRLRIRPQAVQAPHMLPLIETAHAPDQIRSVQVAEIPHAASEGLDRFEPVPHSA